VTRCWRPIPARETLGMAFTPLHRSRQGRQQLKLSKVRSQSGLSRGDAGRAALDRARSVSKLFVHRTEKGLQLLR
jgi:hypothetical protein